MTRRGYASLHGMHSIPSGFLVWPNSIPRKYYQDGNSMQTGQGTWIFLFGQQVMLAVGRELFYARENLAFKSAGRVKSLIFAPPAWCGHLLRDLISPITEQFHMKDMRCTGPYHFYDFFSRLNRLRPRCCY